MVICKIFTSMVGFNDLNDHIVVPYYSLNKMNIILFRAIVMFRGTNNISQDNINHIHIECEEYFL